MSRRRFLKILVGAGVMLGVGGGAAYQWLSPKKPREPMIAYCGLDCTACPDGQFPASCDGCLSTGGRLSRYCREVCEIRPCAQEKGLPNCAPCPDYGCNKLKVIHDRFPAAKDTLDKIRRSL